MSTKRIGGARRPAGAGRRRRKRGSPAMRRMHLGGSDLRSASGGLSGDGGVAALRAASRKCSAAAATIALSREHVAESQVRAARIRAAARACGGIARTASAIGAFRE